MSSATKMFFAAGGQGGSYILESFPGSRGAYSLRVLSPAFVSSDIIDVLRSSDGATSGFTAAEIADGTVLAWVGAGTGRVSKIHDQSGNGNDVICFDTNTARMPKIVTSGTQHFQNGEPALMTDISNAMGTGVQTIDTSVISVFSVHSDNQETSVNDGAAWAIGPSNEHALYTAAATTFRSNVMGFAFGNGTTNNALVVVNAAAHHVSSTIRNGVNATLKLNDTTILAGSGFSLSRVASTLRFLIASRYFGVVGRGLEGYWQEVIWFDSDKSADEAAINAALIGHYLA